MLDNIANGKLKHFVTKTRVNMENAILLTL